MDAKYAFCFVLANFGIAIAAKMPMITTTISSSMSVKPLRFMPSFPLNVVDLPVISIGPGAGVPAGRRATRMPPTASPHASVSLALRLAFDGGRRHDIGRADEVRAHGAGRCRCVRGGRIPSRDRAAE